MPGSRILSIPTEQVVAINDFTPGIIQGVKGFNVWSTATPPGSAATAFRCYARPGIGLCPFPTNKSIGTISIASSQAVTPAAIVSLGMRVVGTTSPQFNESLLMSTIQSGGFGNRFDIYNFDSIGTVQNYTAASTLYSTASTGGLSAFVWPNMDTQVLTPAAVPRRVAVTVDPIQTTPPVKWVTIPAATGTGATSTGTFTASTTSAGSANVFSSSNRVCFIPFGADSVTGGFSTYQDAYQMYTTDIQAMTNITGPNYFFPEMGSRIGAWGTISTGELFLVYTGGGGVIVNGDPQFPTSATKLPGVIGTGNTVGPGCQTSAGLIYVTDFDGAYVWNGGYSSEKISNQIADNQALARIQQQFALTGNRSDILLTTTQHDAWNYWVFFANNWVYDQFTKAWWQVENPATINYQVHKRSLISPQYFYSSDGSTISLNNNLTTLYQWDASKSASSYLWTSNPIPFPGSTTVLEAVEICASNPTATQCTIIITPTEPPGQTLYVNQNTPQSATFTIPPTTTAYRHALPLGWNDYNICINVNASNTTTTNAAPILHEINLGFGSRQS